MFAFAAKQTLPVAKQSAIVTNRVFDFMAADEDQISGSSQRFSCRGAGLENAGWFATSKNPLLHICDLYDTALCLRVLWILHCSHVQFFLAFAECDVCCAITRGDLKYV